MTTRMKAHIPAPSQARQARRQRNLRERVENCLERTFWKVDLGLAPNKVSVAMAQVNKNKPFITTLTGKGEILITEKNIVSVTKLLHRLLTQASDRFTGNTLPWETLETCPLFDDIYTDTSVK